MGFIRIIDMFHTAVYMINLTAIKSRLTALGDRRTLEGIQEKNQCQSDLQIRYTAT